MTDTGSLGAALAAAQAEFPPVERSKTVKVTTKTGGSYTFSYAPLDAIINTVKPVLKKHGLAFSQLFTEKDGRPALETVLLHKDGESLRGVFPLPQVPGGPQELGSYTTYLRRYALQAILGIASEEDDDGNHAAGNNTGAGQTKPDDPRYEQRVQRDNGDVITDKQVKRLWAIFRETGLPEDVLRQKLQTVAGVESSKEIPRAKYEQVVAAIQEEDSIPFEVTP